MQSFAHLLFSQHPTNNVIKTSFADDVKQDDSKRRYLNL